MDTMMQQSLQHLTLSEATEPLSHNEKTFRHLSDLGYEPKNIRLAMLSLMGLTATKIAAQLGVSRPAVTQIIRGDRMTPHIQMRVAEVYDVPVNVLFPERLHSLCKSCPLAN